MIALSSEVSVYQSPICESHNFIQKLSSQLAKPFEILYDVFKSDPWHLFEKNIGP